MIDDVVRDQNGRIRSEAQQEASRLLFDSPSYAPRCPDGVFSLGSEWITYNELVKRLEERAAK